MEAEVADFNKKGLQQKRKRRENHHFTTIRFPHDVHLTDVPLTGAEFITAPQCGQSKTAPSTGRTRLVSIMPEMNSLVPGSTCPLMLPFEMSFINISSIWFAGTPAFVARSAMVTFGYIWINLLTFSSSGEGYHNQLAHI
jgi:hypothetical protein